MIAEKVDIDSTSKLRGLNADSIDLDLDRLATALGTGDTVSSRGRRRKCFPPKCSRPVSAIVASISTWARR
jgi:hypothetical protein